MARVTLAYKGRAIVVDQEQSPPYLTIDGIEVAVYGVGGRFATKRIGYAYFSTVLDLAKALIDTATAPGPGQP